MKKISILSLGLAFSLLVSAKAPAKKTGTTPPVKPVAAVKHAKAPKKTDVLYLFFGFKANPMGSNYYDVSVQFLEYDATNGQFYSGTGINCPANVNIRLTSGPYSGTSFTFPSGSNNYDLGWLFFASDPGGSNYTITTNPTSIDDVPIEQTLYGGQIIP